MKRLLLDPNFGSDWMGWNRSRYCCSKEPEMALELQFHSWKRENHVTLGCARSNEAATQAQIIGFFLGAGRSSWMATSGSTAGAWWAGKRECLGPLGIFLSFFPCPFPFPFSFSLSFPSSFPFPFPSHKKK